jgi:hypothetical protein
MHNELCVMQVYEGVGLYYSGRRFWHCPRAWVRNTTTSISICLFRELTYYCCLQYSYDSKNCSFSQWVDPQAIHPYEEYITYLEGRMEKLKHELAEALTPPDPPSSGDALCTCRCHMKNSPPLSPSPPPPPPFGNYHMPSQESSGFGSMLSGQFSYK